MFQVAARFTNTMLARSVFVLFLLACTICRAQKFSPKTEEYERKVGRAQKPLRVLLVSSFFVGHLVALIPLGEELVGRGHNVTLLTTQMAGSRVVPQLPEKAGISVLSAGPDLLSRQVSCGDVYWGYARGS